MKKDNSSYIIGILFIIFGIMFVISPNSVFESIVFIAGVITAFYGGIKIFISLKSNNPYASLSITGAILSVVFGFVLIANRDVTVRIIPVFLGGFLLVSSLPTLIFLIKNNSNRRLIIKTSLKVIVGFIALLVPVIPVAIFGIVLGGILILSGVAMIMNAREDQEVIYKVRVKK